MTKPSNQDLNVDIELRKGNQELICTIKNFNVSSKLSLVSSKNTIKLSRKLLLIKKFLI